MRFRQVLAATAAFLVIGGGAVGAPCRLDQNDRPINCPGDQQPKAPTATPPTSARAPCMDAKTKKKSIKCPPVMLTPQRVES